MWCSSDAITTLQNPMLYCTNPQPALSQDCIGFVCDSCFIACLFMSLQLIIISFVFLADVPHTYDVVHSIMLLLMQTFRVALSEHRHVHSIYSGTSGQITWCLLLSELFSTLKHTPGNRYMYCYCWIGLDFTWKWREPKTYKQTKGSCILPSKLQNCLSLM